MKTLQDIIPANADLAKCVGLPKIGSQLHIEGIPCTVKSVVLAGAKQMLEWALNDVEVDPSLAFFPSAEFTESQGRQGVVAVLQTDRNEVTALAE